MFHERSVPCHTADISAPGGGGFENFATLGLRATLPRR